MMEDTADRIERVAQAIYEHDADLGPGEGRQGNPSWGACMREVGDAYRRRAAAALAAMDATLPDRDEAIWLQSRPQGGPDDVVALRDMIVTRHPRRPTPLDPQLRHPDPLPTLRHLAVEFPLDGIGRVTYTVAGPRGDVAIEGSVYDFVLGGYLLYPEGLRSDAARAWLEHRMRGEAP